jgi:hypothetical protein
MGVMGVSFGPAKYCHTGRFGSGYTVAVGESVGKGVGVMVREEVALGEAESVLVEGNPGMTGAALGVIVPRQAARARQTTTPARLKPFFNESDKEGKDMSLTPIPMSGIIAESRDEGLA